MSAAPADPRDAAMLSPFAFMRRRFARHRLGVGALFMLLLLYIMALGCEFFAPTTREWQRLRDSYCPPQLPRFSFAEGLYVHPLRRIDNPVTFARHYVEDRTIRIPLGFWVRGESYRLWGLIPWDRHFFGIDRSAARGGRPHGEGVPVRASPGIATSVTEVGVHSVGQQSLRAMTGTGTCPSTASQPQVISETNPAVEATFYLLGADRYGHDILSRLIYGSRISLSVGVIAIVVMFVLGLSIGAVSGYAGGRIDTTIQRVIEIINSLPQLPLWLALGAVLPAEWSPLRIYFCVTLLLSLLGWTGLARAVRGKILALREEDYAMAARLLGASHTRVLFRHLVPGLASHIIVILTLTVPGMILGETALSFLGLGLRPPIVSWGVMLQDCMSLQTVANYPWLLSPVLFIMLTILAFNFAGDAARDAADPHSHH